MNDVMQLLLDRVRQSFLPQERVFDESMIDQVRPIINSQGQQQSNMIMPRESATAFPRESASIAPRGGDINLDVNKNTQLDAIIRKIIEHQNNMRGLLDVKNGGPELMHLEDGSQVEIPPTNSLFQFRKNPNPLRRV